MAVPAISINSVAPKIFISVIDAAPLVSSRLVELQDFNPAATKGVGMKLTAALMKQIGGVLDIGKADHDQGTRFSVRIPPQVSLVADPAN
jgi:sensor histidine kinase regulating citrate/malate metabolism